MGAPPVKQQTGRASPPGEPLSELQPIIARALTLPFPAERLVDHAAEFYRLLKSRFLPGLFRRHTGPPG